jgi:hypothetical protein
MGEGVFRHTGHACWHRNPLIPCSALPSMFLLLLQGATSHCLGQNFSRMFHIEFIDADGGTKLVWQVKSPLGAPYPHPPLPPFNLHAPALNRI